MNVRCDTPLKNEQSMPARTGVHVTSLAGYVSWRRKAGELRCVETVSGRGRSLTESGGLRSGSMVRLRRVDDSVGHPFFWF